jgi:hyperosmotically inducible protein
LKQQPEAGAAGRNQTTTRIPAMTAFSKLFHPDTMLAALASGAALTLLAGCGDSQNADVKAASPPAVSTSVGTKIDDGVVTTRVKSALLADPDVKSFDVKVETRAGEVQLSGFVGNLAQAERAVAIARGVEGVTAVSNKMDLKGSPATVGNAVDDSIITAKIKSALLADPNVKSLDVAVVTRKGEAQLSGFVNNQDQITRVSDLARAVEGVKAVSNEMSIKK